MTSILDKIVAHKQREIEAARQARSTDLLTEQLANAPAVRDFTAALSTEAAMHLIAEVKRASPSAGIICADFDPVAIAKTYEQHGAACVSVLTDEQFFGGHVDNLKAVRQAVSIPVLRKDFILDRYQILEARAAGADCVLLIAECLDDDQLRDLYSYTDRLGMQSLVEIYEPENLDRVLKLQPKLLGVNNRNLRTFVTDLQHSLALCERVGRETIFVSESGIRTREDVMQLEAAGVQAILVGETLMQADDIAAAVEELLGK